MLFRGGVVRGFSVLSAFNGSYEMLLCFGSASISPPWVSSGFPLHFLWFSFGFPAVIRTLLYVGKSCSNHVTSW